MVAISTINESEEAAILNRLLRPEQDNLSVAAARAILKIDFDQYDRDRMHELARKAREGTLTHEGASGD
jgi:hypothetical protein